MIPQGVADDVRERLLPADIMGPPIRCVCSPEAAGVHDQRSIATEFTGRP